MEENYNALRDAIILRAVEDYRTALKILSRNPENKAALSMRQEVEEFFRSDWFGKLTDLNPELLITRLSAEVKRK